MKQKFLAIMMVLAISGISTTSFAHNDNHHINTKAAGRGMNLISVQEVQKIVSERLKSQNVHYKEIELDNKAKHHNFGPVYEIECFADGQEYDIDVDAITGEILKFKLDD